MTIRKSSISYPDQPLGRKLTIAGIDKVVKQDEWKRKNYDGDISEESNIFSDDEKAERSRINSTPTYVAPLRRMGKSTSTNKYALRRKIVEEMKLLKARLTYTGKIDIAFSNAINETNNKLI